MAAIRYRWCGSGTLPEITILGVLKVGGSGSETVMHVAYGQASGTLKRVTTNM
jgi:hypothetical protein